MSQSKYLITTTATPNSIVKRDQAGDINGQAIFLTDQIQAPTITAFDNLSLSSALNVDTTAATFDVPIVNTGQNISCLSLTSGFGGINNAGILTSSFFNLGSLGALPDLSFEQYTVLQMTPTVTTTVSNSICPPAGTMCYLIILTSGTTSRTLTFNSANFRTTGTLATGAVSARYFVISFISDGTKLSETSRTTAMA